MKVFDAGLLGGFLARLDRLVLGGVGGTESDDEPDGGAAEGEQDNHGYCAFENA